MRPLKPRSNTPIERHIPPDCGGICPLLPSSYTMTDHTPHNSSAAAAYAAASQASPASAPVSPDEDVAQSPSTTPAGEEVRHEDLATEILRLQAELAEVKAKNADMADQYLRAKADVENMRRRADDEVVKARKFGIESFAESLLPVCDSLDAALGIHNATAQQLREGTDATLRQLQQALERNKVVVVNPDVGAKFDPHQHQAISVVPAAQEANTIVSVLQKGYLIADRVLRPALVTVAAAK